MPSVNGEFLISAALARLAAALQDLAFKGHHSSRRMLFLLLTTQRHHRAGLFGSQLQSKVLLLQSERIRTELCQLKLQQHVVLWGCETVHHVRKLTHHIGILSLWSPVDIHKSGHQPLHTDLHSSMFWYHTPLHIQQITHHKHADTYNWHFSHAVFVLNIKLT